MPSPCKLLVVDGDVDARTDLGQRLRHAGFETETAGDARDAIAKARSTSPQLVIMDLRTPGMDGIELVKAIHELEDPPAVVVLAPAADANGALAAVREGADHLTTPLVFDELLVVVGRVLQTVALRREARVLRRSLRDRVARGNLVGISAPMQHVLDLVEQVAKSRAAVLITGESGTGKELVANAIHERSSRAKASFIKLHCPALADGLIESELFGCEKSAIGRKDGCLALADRGTLFLDEIGELSPPLQIRLLHLLQHHEFERVGSHESLHADVRVIAATAYDLGAEIARGRFRQDLLYRLDVVRIELPPLRERKSDIPALASHFLARAAKASGKALDAISAPVLDALLDYDWPGNVRELEDVISSAVAFAKGATLEVQDLPLGPSVVPSAMPAIPGSTLAELERFAIVETVKAAGSTSKAAKVLGVSTRTIQYRLHEYQGLEAAQQAVRRTS